MLLGSHIRASGAGETPTCSTVDTERGPLTLDACGYAGTIDASIVDGD